MVYMFLVFIPLSPPAIYLAYLGLGERVYSLFGFAYLVFFQILYFLSGKSGFL